MRDNTFFDNWSGEYDRQIDIFETGYPFEGYYNLLGSIQNSIDFTGKIKVLDLGIGTGLLTYEIYKRGAEIFGIDFSEGMLLKAKSKMPEASFYQFDFNNGLPEEIKEFSFDYIISSYAIHHLNDEMKVQLINLLSEKLSPDGKIIIGDISFNTRNELINCREENGEYWDEEEIYFVADEIIPNLEKIGLKANYNKISLCSGVLFIKK